jgi:hypothetical protein
MLATPSTAIPRRRASPSNACSSVPSGSARAGVPTRISRSLPFLTSFGEDSHGELYATTIDGGLHALR